MPEPKKQETTVPAEQQEAVATSAKAAARYKVKSSGLTGTDGAHYAGEEVTAEQIGDAARIEKLLARKSIEAIR